MQAVRTVAWGGKFYRLPPGKANTVKTLKFSRSNMEIINYYYFQIEREKVVLFGNTHNKITNSEQTPVQKWRMHIHANKTCHQDPPKQKIWLALTKPYCLVSQSKARITWVECAVNWLFFCIVFTKKLLSCQPSRINQFGDINYLLSNKLKGEGDNKITKLFI